MTKAELEAESAEYHRCMAEAAQAIGRGLYATAMNLALSSWKHVDGILQYQRRFAKNEVEQVEAFDLVLDLAPILLDYRALETLGRLLSESRRLAKNDSLALEERLAGARRKLAQTHRLWSLLEETGEVHQAEIQKMLGGDQNEWSRLSESWHAMGLVDRVPRRNTYVVSLATRMGQVVSAKCANCGEVAEAPKSMFFEAMTCPECASRSHFVILKGRIKSEGIGNA